jgi:hypothetical protein
MAKLSIKTIALLLGMTMCVAAQNATRSTVTFSGGLAHNAGNTCCGDSAPAVGLTYAYRIFPHVDLEAGVDSALSLGTEFRGAHYDAKPDDRFIWVPFGLMAVAPLRHGRVEVSVGAGGTYEKYLVGSPNEALGLRSRDGWGGYASFGAAVALDKHRHFWLGTSPRIYFVNADNGYAHDRWFLLEAGLGLRF